MPKVDFKSIGREIRKVQKQVKATRSRAGEEAHARLSELISSLDRLHVQTTEYCPKGMAGEVVTLKRAPARKAAKPKRRKR
jgi:hypothetical protein